MKVLVALTSLVLLLVAVVVEGKKKSGGGIFGFFSSGGNDATGGHLGEDVPSVTLSNGLDLPLVGLGVGSMHRDLMGSMIYKGLSQDNQIHLIDTSPSYRDHISQEVAKGITAGIKRFKDQSHPKHEDIKDDPIQVHVITKVWYTHLGYERTKISVEESLEDLSAAINDPDVDLHLHVLINWPRCYDGVEWMNCEEEEDNLPEELKDATPAPHLDSANAWKGSWKALEDMYKSNPVISSIGVSNFAKTDLEELLQMARVKPHMIQMNVWSLLHDPHLVEVCHQNSIHIQLYNIMHGILANAFYSPHAYHHLLLVANRLQKKVADADDDFMITPAQVILKWLIQYDMSVVPKTSSLERLSHNSAVSLAAIPDLDETNLELVAYAIEAMLTGQDLEEDVYVDVTFHATDKDVYLFYYPGEDEDDVEVEIQHILNGTSVTEPSHPNHQFRLYDADDFHNFKTVTVNGSYGDEIEFHIDLNGK